MKLLFVIVFLIAAVFTIDGRDISEANKIQPLPEDTIVPGDKTIAAEDDHQLIEEEQEQQLGRVRRSRCKARNACVVMGGSCVTNATHCAGRLVPEGCKGRNCQCCVPGTIDARFDTLEMELQTLKEKINNTDSYLKAELHSLEESLGCPVGFFELSDQCFKLYTDSGRNWTDSKSKCRSEGLVLAKPYNPVELNSYLAMRYGNKAAWLGARDLGSNVVWDNDGTTLRSDNPIWWDGHPGNSTNRDSCLELRSYEIYLDDHANQPYYMCRCSYSGLYALCEYIRD